MTKNPIKIAKLGIRFITKNPEKIRTLKIVFLSAWYRFRILTTPMNKIEKKLGVRGEESCDELDIETQKEALRIGRRVEHTARITPWTSNCFVKALTASKLLKEKKISHTIYFGVGNEENKMVAHAWVRSGRIYITGGNGKEYSTVAKFANHCK